jgi:diadenosine tetraphosphate (Ap4A) HIT family hydrolase
MSHLSAVEPTQEATKTIFLSQLITRRSQQEWTKPDPTRTFRGRLNGTRAIPDEVVYEDDFVYAFRHRIDPTLEKWWEIHVVIIPKVWIPTLLDFGIGDAELWRRLIEGIQKVSTILRLYERGFMLRIGVLPPYQHTDHVHIHILSGRHDAPDNAFVAPTPAVE